MKHIAIITLILLSFSIISAQTSNAEKEVFAANKAWADAQAKGDLDALDKIFHNDLIVTSGNGTLRDKKGELADQKPTPDFKVHFFNTEDVRVKVYDKTAIVTGHAKWRVNYQNRDLDHERRYTSVYVKEDGRWQMVALQVTRIGR